MKGKASLAKLSVPAGGPALPRARLFRQIDRALATRRLFWITAPPGAGKTTLATSYLRARRRPTFWYAMDAGDADLATLFHYLALGSKSATGKTAGATRAKGPTLPPLTPERRLGLGAFVRGFFEQLGARLPRNAVLLFDNHHALGDVEQVSEVILAGMSFLREEQRVVVLSRRPPPPSLAAAEASGAMARLEEDALGLTLAETRALVRLRSKTTRAKRADAVHGVARGWVAGVVMLLDHGELDAASDLDTPPVVLDYLAREYLDHLPRETREVLARVVFAPFITEKIALALGGPQASSILRGLARRGAFVTRLAGTIPSYEVHPLLRELVLMRVQARLDAESLFGLRHATAKACLAEGDDETAITLHAANERWEDLANVAEGCAPAMVARGQVETLQRWLMLLPEDLRRARASSAFWLGTCAHGRAPAEAVTWFSVAYDLFASSGDWARQLEAWAGATYNAIVFFDDMTGLPARLAQFDALVPPERLAEVRSHAAVAAYVSAVNYCTYRHPRSPEMGAHGLRLLELEPTDAGATGFLAYALIASFGQAGDIPAMRRTEEIARRLRRKSPNPVWEIHAIATTAYVHLQNAEAKECRQAIAAGLALAADNGISIWNHLLHAFGAVASLLGNDLASARLHLDAIDQGAAPVPSRLARAHHAHLCSLASLLAGDTALALEQSKSAVRTSALLGASSPEMQSRLLLAEVHLARNQPDEAEMVLRDVRAMQHDAQSNLLEAHLRFFEVGIAAARGEARVVVEHLRVAMSLVRRVGPQVLLTVLTTPRSFASFCALALAEGIESDLVEALLRARPLGDFQPDATLEAWPWPVRVHILGRFAVAREGKPLPAGGKQQTRVLELLEILILEGGEASEPMLADCLWPDADGDKAQRALAITVHRLRSFLGDGSLVARRGGAVSLDRTRIYADLWALHALLDRAEAAERAGDRKRAADLHRHAAALHVGPPVPVRSDVAPRWLAVARASLAQRTHGYRRFAVEAGAADH